MTVVSLEEAQARLPELIDQLQQGEGILITRDQQAVAQLVPLANGKPIPQFGSCRGKLTIVSEDEDHLQDFRQEYQTPRSQGRRTQRNPVCDSPVSMAPCPRPPTR
jgi:antitoxin (DNA-binding transcriptional repressor) of toxin-antitoxin stability system